MTINYPGPYEIRVNYTTVASGLTRGHQMRLSLDMFTAADPGDAFSEWITLDKGGTHPALDTVVDDLVLKLKVRFNASSTINDAELWQYTPGTFDAAFRSTYSIAVVGTSGGATVADSQEIYTLRSVNGGNARLTLMETAAAAGPSLAYAACAASVKDVFDRLTIQASPFIARDNGFLFTALKWHPGINEALFKDRYRNL